MDDDGYFEDGDVMFLHCAICDEVLHKHVWGEHDVESSGPTAEMAVVLHMEGQHTFRYWLWRRTGWARAIAGMMG